MSERTYNVLFLCTGNSARSVMAEAVLNSLGRGRFRAFSAGSHPAGAVHPLTIDTLRRARVPVDGLRSKPWEEFATTGAPVMDFVFTVCDRAAGEVCPVWPGQPMTAHWGFEDPVLAAAEKQGAVFAKVFREISTRIQLFIGLPFASLSRLALQREVNEIGLRRTSSAKTAMP